MSYQGELILRHKKVMEFNQFDLAKKIGFTPQFLGRIEKGFVDLPASSVKKLCKILDIDSEDFVRAAVKDFEVKFRSRAKL